MKNILVKQIVEIWSFCFGKEYQDKYYQNLNNRSIEWLYKELIYGINLYGDKIAHIQTWKSEFQLVEFPITDYFIYTKEENQNTIERLKKNLKLINFEIINKKPDSHIYDGDSDAKCIALMPKEVFYNFELLHEHGYYKPDFEELGVLVIMA